MIFGWFLRRKKGEGQSRSVIPTVRFDASRVTMAIRGDLWERIQEFEDLPDGEEARVFEAAVWAVRRGRDMHHLVTVLSDLGVPKSRASYITHYLLNRANALMNVERMLGNGIKEGRWLYSGAPCYWTRNPSSDELDRDAAHRSADRKIFPLNKGMNLNGAWTFPGLEPGCKCITNAVMPDFD